jgi:pimeloyl-ACP methyl ester carboxylesterase
MPLGKLPLPEPPETYLPKLRELQVDLTKLSSNSQYIIAENSGHLIPLEQPDLIVSVVHQLVERD